MISYKDLCQALDQFNQHRHAHEAQADEQAAQGHSEGEMVAAERDVEGLDQAIASQAAIENRGPLDPEDDVTQPALADDEESPEEPESYETHSDPYAG